MAAVESRKIAVKISYDGSSFFGWQRQKNQVSVQERIEDTLGTIFQRKTVVHSAGRTDAGVHAIGQVAHFDSPQEFEPLSLAHSLNSMLPPSIRITNAAFVDADFHSRFSAVSKTYFYIINNSKILSPFLHNYCCHLPDFHGQEKIASALEFLKGEHNFERFTTADAVGESPVRRFYSAKLIENGNFIFIAFTASGFLRYLVRTLVGTLVKIGMEKIPLSDFQIALEGGVTKPLPSTLKMNSAGLYLLKVNYNTNPFVSEKNAIGADDGYWPFIKEINLCRLSDLE